MIKFNSDVRKLLKKSWLWLVIVVASAGVWLMAFYWASQPSSALTFEIWIGAEENPIDGQLYSQLETICKADGMKKLTVRAYNPNDYFYAQAFALEARSIEIFILHKDEALTIQEQTQLFRVLDEGSYANNTLDYEGSVFGVEFTQDYYVMINATSKKSDELLFAVFNALVSYGVNE